VAIDQATRTLVRHAYHYRCGYCGISEAEVGSELEIDHFQPRSVGGGDELENLVYCYTACNRHKGDFWPLVPDTPRRLLHPQQNNPAAHLFLAPDGHLVALTETRQFHLDRLRLNRPHLTHWRQTQAETQQLRTEVQAVLSALQTQQGLIQEHKAMTERLLEKILAYLARLKP
jgi:HNH endonuclease